jgi:hypothetical protein
MRKRSKWGDFWFTVCVRVICGLILGGLAGVLFGGPFRSGTRGILWHLSHDDFRWVVVWMSAWIIGGAIVSVFTVPYWQWPWYRGRDDDDNAA